MQVGNLMFFQNHPWLPMTDAEVYVNELAVADMTARTNKVEGLLNATLVITNGTALQRISKPRWPS